MGIDTTRAGGLVVPHQFESILLLQLSKKLLNKAAAEYEAMKAQAQNHWLTPYCRLACPVTTHAIKRRWQDSIGENSVDKILGRWIWPHGGIGVDGRPMQCMAKHALCARSIATSIMPIAWPELPADAQLTMPAIWMIP